MKTKWILSIVLAAAVSAPAFAQTTPLGDNIAPTAVPSQFGLRPVVQGSMIAWGDYNAGVVGGSSVNGCIYMYDVNTAALNWVGTTDNNVWPADWEEVSWTAAWAPWTPQIGLEGDYLYYSNIWSDNAESARRYQISTGISTRYSNLGQQKHFADGNAAGMLVVQDWEGNMTARLIDANTWDGTNASAVFSAQSNEFGTAPRISGNIMTWQDDHASAEGIGMYNLTTATQSMILSFDPTPTVDITGDGIADKPALDARFPQISNDGSKIVTWVNHWDNLLIDQAGSANDKPATDIRVYDVATGVWTVLVDQLATDEQPWIDGDYLVWDRFVAANNWDIMGMKISTGEVFVIDAGSRNARYASVDASGLVAWSVDNTSLGSWNGTIHYTMIPEPASLALLALGGLALLRRR
ncbi:MAG: PEP-CTERM sorting domain-containing protein [Phycisphaeraceae bacterium]|nr:PEP-CTERM sorting domain-containing protein [Phycisphaeraceae bacterium]